jgi:hypothetical protein
MRWSRRRCGYGEERGRDLLAQASMARVVDSLAPTDKPVPILSSPRLAVRASCRLLRKQ